MATREASGIAKGGLITGVIATSISGLLAANSGFFGGLFGNNQAQQAANMAAMGVISQKDSEIAELKAQRYSDQQDSNLYKATRSENEKLWNNVKELVNPIGSQVNTNTADIASLKCEVSKNAEIATLREELVKSQLGAKIDAVACQASNGINMLNSAVAGINNTLNGIICNKVQLSAICPEPMQRWNAWAAPATGESAPAVQPITGSLNVRQV